MKTARAIGAVGLFAGMILVVLSSACSGGGDGQKSVSSSPSATETPTDTPSPTPTQAPTPTPTPLPFDGKVARMKVPSLGIDNPIEELGLLPSNQLDTPHQYWTDIGWYPQYGKPGFQRASFFSAHVNYEGKDGPFAKLGKSNIGDEIDVVMKDGPTYVYKITRKQRYDVNTIDMGALLDPPDRKPGEELITLMTCSCDPGRFVPNPGSIYGECLDRDVVVATRVS